MSATFSSLTTDVLKAFTTRLNTITNTNTKENRRNLIDSLPVVLDSTTYVQSCSINTNDPSAGDINNIQTSTPSWNGTFTYTNHYFWLIDPANPKNREGTKCVLKRPGFLYNSGVTIKPDQQAEFGSNIVAGNTSKENAAFYQLWNNDPNFSASYVLTSSPSGMVQTPLVFDNTFRGYLLFAGTVNSTLILEKLFSEKDRLELVSYIQNPDFTVYLTNDGSIEVIFQDSDPPIPIRTYLNSRYSITKKSSILSGTKIDSLSKDMYLSKNGLFILYIDPDDNTNITVRMNIFNTTNFLQMRQAQSLSEEQMKGMYETYCSATRFSATPGDWLDPRCTCVMLDDNIRVLNGGAPGISTVSSYVRSHSPCMMTACFSNINDTSDTYPYYFRSTCGCSSEITICRETFDIRNSKVGNINMQSCNNRASVMCTADDKCAVGEACSNSMCRRTCSFDVRCPSNFTCTKDGSKEVCLPNPTISEPTVTLGGGDGSNTVTTTIPGGNTIITSPPPTESGGMKMSTILFIAAGVLLLLFVLYNIFGVSKPETTTDMNSFPSIPPIPQPTQNVSSPSFNSDASQIQ